MKRFEAVLFDMDGVLVDSMPYHFISWFETMKKYGIRVTPFEIYEKEGEKSEICVEYFFKREGLEITKEKVNKITKERKKIFNGYFKPYIFKGVGQILAKLGNAGYKIAIVTGSGHEDALKMLPKKIYNLFDAVITSDMVKTGKPDPEPYLKAAEILGIEPARCMVIENAPCGIKSAKSAGMYCVGVTTSLPKEYLNLADKICGSVSGVFERYPDFKK